MDETTTEERKMTKAEFWIRFALWVIFALVVPFVYLAIAYGLFGTKDETTSLSGWGVVAIIFVCIVLLYIVGQAKKALPYGSLARQCVSGYMALIPLILAILVIHATKNNVESFERFLIVIAISEAIAVPINPMEKWGAQNGIERSENIIFRAISRAMGKKEK